jgi:predicted Fe-Mo cluster-binding NifX family protein/ferredoxin
MKIAVTSTGPTLDDYVEARFGRCQYFLIVDTETMQTEVIENPNIALGGGAGIQSAQLMSEKGVTTVLTGNCGPNAFNVFGQAGVQVIVGVTGSVRNSVERFKAGAFSSATEPNVTSHFGVNAAPTVFQSTGQSKTNPMGQDTEGLGFGMGGSRGMGGGRGMGGSRGMGGGRGMGRGGGMGRGIGKSRGMGRGMNMSGGFPAANLPASSPTVNEPANQEQELAALKQQAVILEQQKQQLYQRILQLESGRRAVAVVDSEKCAGCGICVDVCPTSAIEVNQQAVVNDEVCTGCAACVSECPNEAITIVQKKVDK